MHTSRLVFAARLLAMLGAAGCRKMPVNEPELPLEPAPPGARDQAPAACLDPGSPARKALLGGDNKTVPGGGWLSLGPYSEIPTIKLCHPKGDAPCETPTQIAPHLGYQTACCAGMGMERATRGPTIERVRAPAECAGLLVCCYEGPYSSFSGPGRALRVAGASRVAALRRDVWG
jgi:hypothetical protein